MEHRGAAAFCAAQDMLGVRFALQGRDRGHALDCVGLITAAYHAADMPLAVPDDYPLRGWSAQRVAAAFERSGLERSLDALPQMGDVALIRYQAGQFHLGLIGDGEVIHAHAGLRRVVQSPWDAHWAQAELWRWPARDDAG